jgi:hypothetical protein
MKNRSKYIKKEYFNKKDKNIKKENNSKIN